MNGVKKCPPWSNIQKCTVTEAYSLCGQHWQRTGAWCRQHLHCSSEPTINTDTQILVNNFTAYLRTCTSYSWMLLNTLGSSYAAIYNMYNKLYCTMSPTSSSCIPICKLIHILLPCTDAYLKTAMLDEVWSNEGNNSLWNTGDLRKHSYTNMPPYLAQGTVGLLIEEFHLVGARAGLLVGHTPGHLQSHQHRV